MAKQYYKVKTRSNFSFKKLAANMDEIIEESKGDLINSIARNTKKNILTGGLRKLSNATLEARKEGKSSFAGHNSKPTTETRPLYYTGRLYKSIKATKDGMEIMEYGLDHHEGFTTPSKDIGYGSNKTVYPRRFIAADESGKYGDRGALAKEERDIVRKMNLTMKKKRAGEW